MGCGRSTCRGATTEGGGKAVAIVGVNEEMQTAAAVDDSMSWTTAVAALVAGGALHVANVGDLRAVTGVWRDGHVAVEEVSWDQMPFHADESARVKACGARVMSVEQVEGVRDPDAEGWLAYEGYPASRLGPRWALPEHGLHAQPRVKAVEITPAHPFVVASDGVFEFLEILLCTPTRCLMRIPEGWQGRISLCKPRDFILQNISSSQS